jgi:Zn-dependent M28 family amino/carboxypeptidase
LAAQQGFVGMRGVFNLEMTAYDSDNDGAIHVIDCNEGLSSSLSARMMQSISENEIALQKIPACTNRSDHAAFWQHGQPAIVISQNFFGRPADSNPCYHRSCDTVDNLNFSYMAKVTLAVSHAIRSLIQ